MIINTSKGKNISAKLKQQEINDIKLFIKGAVYSYCNNCLDKDGNSNWFSVYTLFGKDKYYWKYPLISIYDYHIQNGKNNATAISLSGQDLGHLLKEVLLEDVDRKFEQDFQQRKFNVNSYRLIKNKS